MAEFIGRWFTPSDSDGSGEVKPKPGPTAPQIVKATEKAIEGVKKRRQAANRTQSVRTSPLGLGAVATTAKKALLGQ